MGHLSFETHLDLVLATYSYSFSLSIYMSKVNINTQNVDDKSDTTETTTSDADNHAASNFLYKKKPKLQMKRKSAGKNQDVTNAEVQVLQSIGNALGHQN